MKIKKLLAMLLSVVTAFTCFAAIGCGGKKGGGDKGGNDPSKTVNLQIGTGGYGDAYMKELIAKFEYLHRDKGWKINLLEPMSDFGTKNAADQMFQGAEDTGWDLVFPGSVFVWDVVDAPSLGTAVENISDLYEQVPYGFDGKEENIKLKDKVDLPAHFRWAIANGKNYDNYYGFAMTGSMRGVGVNTAVLAKYGYQYGNDETTPMYTTAQFIDVIHGIYEASEGEMAPMIFGGDNAATYSVSGYTVQRAQNLGEEAYLRDSLNWMEEQYEGIPSDGYKYYTEDPTRQVAMEYVAATWDFLAAYTGSGGLQHTDAHYKLAKGDAAFMFDGNYLFNEISLVGASTADMRFMHVPTSTYVGIRNDLCGAGHDMYNNKGTHFSGRVAGFEAGEDFCKDCDNILAEICKLVDEGKTVDQIVDIINEGEFTVVEEQVEDVMFARTVYYGGFTSGGYIMKNCGVEHIAKEFLRMLASDDAAQLYAKYGMVSAFKGETEVEISETAEPMLKDVFELMKNAGFMVYCHREPGTVAGNLNVTEWGKTYSATMGAQINADPIMAITDGLKLQDRQYVAIAAELVRKADKDLQNNWSSNVTAAGYKFSESGYMGYMG